MRQLAKYLWNTYRRKHLISGFSHFLPENWHDKSASTMEINCHGESMSCSPIVDHTIRINLNYKPGWQSTCGTLMEENII